MCTDENNQSTWSYHVFEWNSNDFNHVGHHGTLHHLFQRNVTNKYDIIILLKLSLTIVCVREQHYVSIFFTRLWSVRKPLLFRYMGRLVTNQQKCFFFSFSASFFLTPFGFVFIRMRT